DWSSDVCSSDLASITVKPSYGLSDEEVAAMLTAGMESAEADMRARALREQQVEARRLVESVRAALEQDADLLSDAERQAIDEALVATAQAEQLDDADTVKALTERLSAATDDFAAKRMDRSIRKALSGRSLDDVVSK